MTNAYSTLCSVLMWFIIYVLLTNTCRCIRDLLSDKYVVLVTHQLQYLQQCDLVLGLKEVSALSCYQIMRLKKLLLLFE